MAISTPQCRYIPWCIIQSSQLRHPERGCIKHVMLFPACVPTQQINEAKKKKISRNIQFFYFHNLVNYGELKMYCIY